MRLALKLLVALALLLAPGCTPINLSLLPSRAPGVPAAGQPAEQRDGEGGLFPAERRRKAEALK